MSNVYVVSFACVPRLFLCSIIIISVGIYCFLWECVPTYTWAHVLSAVVNASMSTLSRKVMLYMAAQSAISDVHRPCRELSGQRMKAVRDMHVETH